MTLLNRKRILHPTKTPEDSKEMRGRSDPRRADIVEPEEEEEKEGEEEEEENEERHTPRHRTQKRNGHRFSVYRLLVHI